MLGDNVLIAIDQEKISKHIEVPSSADPRKMTKVLSDFNKPTKITVVAKDENCQKVKEGDVVYIPTPVLNRLDDVTEEIGEKVSEKKSYGICKEFEIQAVLK